MANFIFAIYFFNYVSVEADGEFFFSFIVSSGVLQGCSLSGTLFVLVGEPFLQNILDKMNRAHFGLVRACADDLGAVINNISHLRFFARLFDVMFKIANLQIKPKKCKIVPLHDWNKGVATLVSDWIALHLPQWSEFAVVSQAEYLGFWLGPCTE